MLLPAVIHEALIPVPEKVLAHADKARKGIESSVNAVTAPAFQILSGQTFTSLKSFLGLIKTIVIVKQIVSIFWLPYYCRSVFRHAVAAYHETRPKRRLDHAIDVLDSSRAVGESTSALFYTLRLANLITDKAFVWGLPFAGVMSVLSAVSIVKNTRACFKTRGLLKEIKRIKENENGTVKKASDVFKEFVAHAKVKQEENFDFSLNTFYETDLAFLDRISEDIEQKSLTEAEKEAEYAKKMESIKRRISKNIRSSALAAISATINVIGTVLILCCPILPVGWVLVAIGGTLDFVHFCDWWWTNRKFKQEIGITDPVQTAAQRVLCTP
jgi:hypothetical protein